MTLLIFAGCSAVAIAFSPIGNAVAARIRRGGAPDPHLSSEVDELRIRLAEVEERLDFAERAVASGPAERRTTLEGPA